MVFHIYTTFHISLTHPFTKPYTPIPSINIIPFWPPYIPYIPFSKLPNQFQNWTISYSFIFFLLSSINIRLFISSLTVAELTSFPNPSSVLVFFIFIYYLLYIPPLLLRIANNIPKTRASSSKRPHIEESPQEEEENLSKTYKSKFLILSHTKGTKLTTIRFREILGCKYIHNSLLNNMSMLQVFDKC